MDSNVLPFWRLNLRVDNNLVNDIDTNNIAVNKRACKKHTNAHTEKKYTKHLISKSAWFYAMPLLVASMHLHAADTTDQPTSVVADANPATAVDIPAEKRKRKEPTFNIWEYEIHGVKVFEAETIENAMSQFLGQEKTLATVEAAAHELERLYRDSGYPVVVVDIPEQDVVGGKVKLLVTEGVVSNVKVSGSDYFLLSDIKARVSSVKEGGPVYIPKLQQELNSLNSLSSDLRVTPILKQGEEPGSVGVELKVKDQLPMHGEIEYNNYASANTTPTRLSASIGYDNLWSKFHSFSLTMMTTPEDTREIRVLSGTYVLPIENGTSRLALYGVYSDSQINILANLKGINVLGKSKIAGLRYLKPMNPGAGFSHTLTLGFDYKDVLEEITLSELDKNQIEHLATSITPITFGLWTAEYKATWRRENSSTQLGAGVYFGIRNIFNDEDEFGDKRYNSSPNFMYWKGHFQETTKLPADFELVNKIKLQISSESLISNEQLSIGGSNSVRGYFESQSMGDRGAITSMEVFTPKLLKDFKTVSDLKAYLFVDGGVLEVINPLPDQKNNFELASAGLGVEFQSFKDIKAELNWSLPLIDSCNGICGQNLSDIGKGDSLTKFSVTYKY